MDAKQLNKLGLRLNANWNIFDLLSMTREDGLTDSQFEKVSVLRDVINEYNLTVPVDNKSKITTPDDASALLYNILKGKAIEEFWVVFLNSSNRVIRRKMLSLGGHGSTIIDNREVCKQALQWNAAGIIMYHNHPSGDPTPSNADINMTESLRSALETLDITLVDHLVISDGSYYSFVEQEVKAYAL